MRPPIAFVYGNCLFATGLDDPWAAFALESHSYAWLTEEEKRGRMAALGGALEALQADFQLIRVSSGWPVDVYVGSLEDEICGRGGRGRMGPGLRYLHSHRRRLAELRPARVRAFLVVSLREPKRDMSSVIASAAGEWPRDWRRRVLGWLTLRERKFVSVAELERLRVSADRVHACLADFLPVRPARAVELQWLIRRVFCRDLGEPEVDGLHEPSALVFERNGQAILAPLEGDVMRWADGVVESYGRLLRVDSELGRSTQTLLVMGALPERLTFPGAAAELMFAPPESLPFGIDITLNARFVRNKLAARIARRRIQDADQILRAESDGEQGVSGPSFERTNEARDLLAYLQSSSRPPLLRCTLSVAVASRDEEELEERVRRCRRAYGEVRLHRPVGEQLQLFLQHLPAQRTRVVGYDDMLTIEQVAAMMPTATHEVGSGRGFYLGHSLSGSRRPVRFNLREGSEATATRPSSASGRSDPARPRWPRSSSTRHSCSADA